MAWRGVMGGNRSLWSAMAGPHAPSDMLGGDDDCDVIVVGAGFTGLRAALALAEAGTDVIVVDRHDVGWGASGRNGGQVNPMLPVKRPEDLHAAIGSACFERLAAASLGSADELFALIKHHHIECGARQDGWLRVDHCAAAREAARRAATAWSVYGAAFEFLDGDDVRALTGSPAYASAVLAPRGGAVQPLLLVRGLAGAAREAGARIFRDAPVTGAHYDGKRWQLTIGKHRVKAASVIVATNGYSDDLVGGLRRSILPLTPVQMATKALEPEAIDPILPKGQTISDTRRMIMYARREPGGQMVFGGMGYRRAGGGIGGFGWLLRDVERIFPSLRGVNWRYRWSGQIAITDDRVPHLHEPAPGMVAGLGYNGRGVAMSMVMGRVLAERTLGAALDTLPFPVSPIRPQRFRNIQVRGAGAAMAWMRLRDRWEWR